MTSFPEGRIEYGPPDPEVADCADAIQNVCDGREGDVVISSIVTVLAHILADLVKDADERERVCLDIGSKLAIASRAIAGRGTQ
jgi:hypothetical protein